MSESGILEDPRVRAIIDLFVRTAIVLERPAVQRQLLVFGLVLFTAWLLSYLLQRTLLRRRPGRKDGKAGESIPTRARWGRRLSRWLRAVGYMLFPLFCLALGQLAIVLFDKNGWRSGLIQQLIPVFWLLLIYRGLGGLLRAIFVEARADRYIRRFLRPLFILLVIIIVRNGIAGTFSLGAIKLIDVMDVSVTVQSLFSAAIVLYFFLVTAWILRDILDRAIEKRDPDQPATAQVISMISYYAIIGFGVLFSAATLGFNLSAIIIVFGGLSVGIGFGLQELVANFISGILLLFEQSLRPGDVIEVENRRGTVDQLRPRATVLRTVNNIEIFVPNKSLLTSTVSTYTLSDRRVRQTVAVGVSYASDPQIVRRILLDIAGKHGLVLKDPEPIVFFSDFGESSLLFELAFWIDEPTRQLNTTSDLRFMIWSEFKKYGIEIPFPQRDLHILSGEQPFPDLPEIPQGDSASREPL